MITPISNLSLNDVKAIATLLQSEVENHKKLNGLYCRWFNELVPEGADLPEKIEYSNTQVLLQQLATYHAHATIVAQSHLSAFEGLVNAEYGD